jgi:hypothetical protein
MPDPQLKYRFQPDRVFTGLTASLTLEIHNDTPTSITFGRNDWIVATFPAGEGTTALSAAVDYTPVSLTPNFTAERIPSTNDFRVRISGFQARSLASGASILVRFDGVKVNAVIGDVNVPIIEHIGTAEARDGARLSKIAKELNVIAWLERPVVGQGETTRLNWQSFGATRIVIAGFADSVVDPNCSGQYAQAGYRCFRPEGQPPYPGSVEVGIGRPADSQRRYTVIARTDTGESKQVEVTLTQHKPEIAGFGVGADMTRPTDPVGAMAEVQLLWSTVYGRRAWLITPTNSAGTQVAPNPAATLPVTPGLDALRAAASPRQIPATADYTLRVSGFDRPAEETLSFQLGPVGAAYFKYEKMDNQGKLSDPIFAVNPRGWPGVQKIVSTPPYTLTVFGPGGTVQVLYLGPGDAVNPQVQFFDAVPGQGNQKTLRWVTANVTSLRLDPGGYQVPAAQIAKGSYEVTPTQTTEYVLWATAANGVKVTSSLLVTVP